jgi:hypothetical protein
MRPGQQQSFDVHKAAVLRVGDPAAFTFTINGEVGRSLGGRRASERSHYERELSRFSTPVSIHPGGGARTRE